MSCISAHDPQLARLADAIAQRVGQQRFHVWFNNSTRLDLKNANGVGIAHHVVGGGVFVGEVLQTRGRRTAGSGHQ